MDSKKINLKRIFLIFGGILVLLAIILLFVTREKPEKEKEIEIQGVSTQEEGSVPQLPPASKEEQAKNNILIIASSFAERFGSYSNQGNFENIKDLHSFMTPSLQNWSDGYTEKQRAEYPDLSVYYGMTTKVISSKLLAFDDGVGYAKVTISTQRREANGSMENGRIFYQDIEIELEKVVDTWKIDGVWWR